MKMTVRNKRIFIILASFALLIAVFLLVFRPFIDSSEKLEAENQELEAKYGELLEIQSKEEQYRQETSKMQEEIDTYAAKFPAGIRAEDGFLLAMNMENAVGMSVNSVSLEENQMISSVGGVTVTDNGEEDPTLSEKTNEQTEEAINEIEGYNVAAETLGVEAINPEDMILYKTVNNMIFTGSYESMKKAIDYINSQSNRMTIDNLSAAFDSGTGNLSGSITVNMYSMSNTGKEYTEPSVPGVALGKQNIFGTVEVPPSQP